MLKNSKQKDREGERPGRNAGIAHVLEILEHWKKHPDEERMDCLSTIIAYLFSWTKNDFGEPWVAKVAEKMHRIMAIGGDSPEAQKDVLSRLLGFVAFLADTCPHPEAVREGNKDEHHPCCRKGCDLHSRITIRHEFEPGDEPGNLCMCPDHVGDSTKAFAEILALMAMGKGPVAITITRRMAI